MNMNVQELRLRLSNLNQDLRNIWRKFRDDTSSPDDQQHVMSEEEQLDETIKGSFPASDPPGHISKSATDKELH
jgi:hypothetical protein